MTLQLLFGIIIITISILMYFNVVTPYTSAETKPPQQQGDTSDKTLESKQPDLEKGELADDETSGDEIKNR